MATSLPKCDLCKERVAAYFVGGGKGFELGPYYYCQACKATYPKFTHPNFVRVDADEFTGMDALEYDYATT